MIFTDKANKLFKEWLKSHNDTIEVQRSNERFYEFNYSDIFYNLPQSMQFGVIQDWADSLGIILDLNPFIDLTVLPAQILGFWVRVEKLLEPHEEFSYDDSTLFKSRQQAREAAIQKLNELINEE